LKKILHLTLDRKIRESNYVLSVLGRDYAVDEQTCPTELSGLRSVFEENIPRYDAIASSGMAVVFFHKGVISVHSKLKDISQRKGSCVITNGLRVRSVLDRHLARRALVEMNGDVRDRRILMLSAIERLGLAEVIADCTSEVVFGDMIFSLRWGLPLHSMRQVEELSKRAIPVMLKLPLAWFDPRARRGHPIFQPFQWWFDWAEIIVGSAPYFRRYAPKTMDGKVVLADYSESDIDYFRESGVSTLVSLDAHLDGRRVPSAILHAVYRLSPDAETGPTEEGGILEMIHRLKIEPRITQFAPGGTVFRFDASSRPESLLTPDVRPVRANEEVGRFAFVLHPLNAEQCFRHPLLGKLRGKVPTAWVERMVSRAPVLLVDHITGLVSKTGACAEGWVFALVITPREMLRLPSQYVYRRLLEVAERGGKLGAGILGLGAYTSVVGDAGETLAKMSPIAITTGNTYTVAATIESIEVAAKRIGVDLRESTALVIGATGSIGSAISHLLARKTASIKLVSPRPERLLELASAIERRVPGVDIGVSTSVERFLPDADVVVTTTSAVGSIVDVDRLRPGALVCDVARPPDIREESARRRPDVLVFEAGEILPPCEVEMAFDIGLPPNTIYACLAETMILALEGRYENYTLGRRMDVDKVDEIAALGAKHGFGLAPLTTFGRELSNADFDRVAAARLRTAVNKA